MKIVHALPGRLRLELNGLYRNPGLAALLENRLKLITGISYIRADSKTGRILVLYSPDRLRKNRIRQHIKHILTVFNESPKSFQKVEKPGEEKIRQLKAYELEDLPIGRQVLLTGISGMLLLYTSLKQNPILKRPGVTTGPISLNTAITVLTGYPVLRTALEHLLKKGRLSSELLASVASLSSLVMEDSRFGLFVVFLIYLSTLIQTLALERARDRIRVMLEGRRPKARVKTAEGSVVVTADRVAPGAVVIVKRGERIPVDGRICSGTGLVNQCPVKGEHRPVRFTEGAYVYAGNTVMDGELYIEVDRVAEETYIGRVIQILENKSRHHSYNKQVTRLMNKISFLSLASAAGVYLLTGNSHRAVAMLVVGTPGAAGMASSMPLETASGKAAGRGILIKNGRHMETVGLTDTVLFDKTTLLSRKNDYDLEAVEMLREAKKAYIGLLTGEPVELTVETARRLKLKAFWPACQTQDKLKVIRRLQKKGHIVAVIGDRTDDVPALSAADVGIAMARGNDLTLESADIVIAGNDPRQLAELSLLARHALAVARQNVALSIGINILGLSLGALNLLSGLTMAVLQNVNTFAILFNTGRLLLPLKPEVSRRKLLAEAAVTMEAHNRGRIITKRRDKKPLCQVTALQDMLSGLKVDPGRGLSFSEVAIRRQIYGYNELPAHNRTSVKAILKEQLQNYMNRVLLGIAGISLLLGREGNALMSTGVLFVNTVLAVLQERRTENSMQMLSGLVAPRARVVRNGKKEDLPARELVPGDIIMVESGDKVPADARILEAWRLVADEASLTGESLPVIKQDCISGRNNNLYMGTSVLSGRAKALVVNTGSYTEVGRIARIMSVNDSRYTPLHKRLDELGGTLVRVGLAVSSLTLLAGFWHGENTGNILTNALNLAISVIPDGLTPIITLTMTMSALRMAKRRVIVRRLPAVGVLGSASVLCCDKTGTLTGNQMTVREIFCAGQHCQVLGDKYIPVDDEGDLEQLFLIAVLCNNAVIKESGTPKALQAEGDSTECALLLAAAKVGVLQKIEGRGFSRLEENPFSPDTMYMSVICQDVDYQKWSFVKGAPDIVLEKCASIRNFGRVEALTQKEKNQILLRIRDMSGRALRVLALAYKPLAAGANPEKNLIFSGLVGIMDPPRAESKAVLNKCRRAGIQMVMITGDHGDTARAVAEEIGIGTKKTRVITGDEIEQMTDGELLKTVDRVSIYARTSPRHKLRLIKVLKQQGHVVAMIGDGVNDVLAIKEAHLGIAMGKSGTAVTREVASVTLAGDNIAVVPVAIKEGRAVYANIRKCIRYLLVTNLGDGMVILTSALLGRPVPVNPFQLLCVNLGSDPLVSWALANDPPGAGIMSSLPHKPDESIFSRGLGRRIITRSLFLGLGALAVYNGSLARGESLALTQTKTMAALGLGRFFYLFNCRREKFGRQGKPVPNKGIMAGGALLLATLLGAVYIPFIRPIFKTVPLGFSHWLPVLTWTGLTSLADTGLNFLLEPGETAMQSSDNCKKIILSSRVY